MSSSRSHPAQVARSGFRPTGRARDRSTTRARSRRPAGRRRSGRAARGSRSVASRHRQLAQPESRRRRIRIDAWPRVRRRCARHRVVPRPRFAAGEERRVVVEERRAVRSVQPASARRRLRRGGRRRRARARGECAPRRATESMASARRNSRSACVLDSRADGSAGRRSRDSIGESADAPCGSRVVDVGPSRASAGASSKKRCTRGPANAWRIVPSYSSSTAIVSEQPAAAARCDVSSGYSPHT